MVLFFINDHLPHGERGLFYFGKLGRTMAVILGIFGRCGVEHLRVNGYSLDSGHTPSASQLLLLGARGSARPRPPARAGPSRLPGGQASQETRQVLPEHGQAAAGREEPTLSRRAADQTAQTRGSRPGQPRTPQRRASACSQGGGQGWGPPSRPAR